MGFRPLRAGEEQPIRDLDARLTMQSRYLRFFSPFPQIPDNLVRQLAAVDGHRSVAILAEDLEDGRPIGLGGFNAADDRLAEVALVVCDEWQRRGIGTELARRVLDAAEAQRYERFAVSLHDHNVAIRRLLARVGEVVVTKMVGGGVLEVEFVRRRCHDGRPEGLHYFAISSSALLTSV